MSWILTFTGKRFDYEAPTVDAICIEDIAQALSHECRFNGHIPEFYSVAQHCVIASKIVPPSFAFEALLHDAHEAYCKDIPSPLKKLIPDYRGIENNIDFVIRYKFGLPPTTSQIVKHADLVMLATERRDLDIDDGTPWPMLNGIRPSEDIFVSPVNPVQARAMFMQRYNQLASERAA
ncbi:HD family hydrolase [Serratia sp. K-E0102]|uniref:HD family hydrolase n=1 Tax=Serratia sp. K-E0102 TaxID=3021405 RepID=UPI00249E7B23|nr:HD family hydrolase [Serratia sp. K-E0102]WGZ68755.1 HD family hydrolase [Serratia sp. K-E0102]